MTQSANNLPVIFLMGPTASGKTDLARQLHQQLDCELISVDSAMVYRGFNIGSAKPTTQELEEAPHHLIDICSPEQPYSVSQFCVDAKTLITDSLTRGNIPVLVGGSMLYFKALRDGLAELPSADQQIRKQLAEEAKQQGWLFMHEKLKLTDPESARRIKSGDGQRIQRALEVFMISGKTLSQFFKEQQKGALAQQIIHIAIAPKDRAVLVERIEHRFEQMLQQGFIKEVEHLFKKEKLSTDLPAMKSVGYRQVCEYLAGEIDYKTMQEKAIVASRQLAKRQMTWLRSWPDVNWLESAATDNIKIVEQLILTFLKDFK